MLNFMAMDVKKVLEGWGNLILRPGHNSELSKTRISICNTCDVRSGVICNKNKGGCGCVLPAKVRTHNAKCPKGKW